MEKKRETEHAGNNGKCLCDIVNKYFSSQVSLLFGLWIYIYICVCASCKIEKGIELIFGKLFVC